MHSDRRDMLSSEDSEQMHKCFYVAAVGIMIVDHQREEGEKKEPKAEKRNQGMCVLETGRVWTMISC